MVAIKLYDIENGHVETLAEVPCAEAARVWVDTFGSGGIGANDVIYTTEVDDGAVRWHTAFDTRMDSGQTRVRRILREGPR